MESYFEIGIWSIDFGEEPWSMDFGEGFWSLDFGDELWTLESGWFYQLFLRLEASSDSFSKHIS